jgi:ribosome-associated translation inhibitor RaiA
VLHRLHFALWRFHERVSRVTVRLSDLNGPRGGVDKACRVRIRLHGMTDIRIEDAEEDLYVAISRAADRAGRTLGRRLHRGHGDNYAVTVRSERERTE